MRSSYNFTLPCVRKCDSNARFSTGTFYRRDLSGCNSRIPIPIFMLRQNGNQFLPPKSIMSPSMGRSSFRGSRCFTLTTFLKHLESCFDDLFSSALCMSKEEWRRGYIQVWHSSDQVLGSSKILRYE